MRHAHLPRLETHCTWPGGGPDWARLDSYASRYELAVRLLSAFLVSCDARVGLATSSLSKECYGRPNTRGIPDASTCVQFSI